MANEQISELTALTTPADADVVPVVDVSDTSISVTGQTKKITVDNLILSATQTLTNKTLTSPVINTGVSGTAVLDDDSFGTASSTTVATSESIKAYVDTQLTAEDLDFAGDSGTGSVDLDSQTFTIDTGANLTTAASGQALTVNLDTTITGLTSVTSTDFVGSVTGDVTGDLTGDSAGTHTGAVTGNVTGNVTGDVTGDLTGDSAGTHTGAVTGNVTGNVTGDVTGDVTGNVTGNVTGDLTGDVTGDVTGDLTGNADTVTTNANLTGEVISVGNAATIADDTVDEANLKVDNSPTDDYVLTAKASASGGLTWAASGGGGGSGTVTSVAITGSDGIDVDSGSPITSSGTIALGLSGIANSALTNSAVTVGTTAISLGASSTTLAGLTSVTSTGFTGDLTGDVTGDVSGSSGSCTGNAATVTNGVYTTNNLSVMAATTSAQLAGVISDETGSGSLVFATSPTLVTPALGTPASGVLTNCTGTASGLTAGTVTTNANLTGDVTSSGSNATTIAAGAVDIAMLSATGTASGTTYLRGDNTWSTVSGGGGAAIGDAVTSATEGSVLFAGADGGSGGVLAQDNSDLFWDDSNKRLGIGTANAPDNNNTTTPTLNVAGDDLAGCAQITRHTAVGGGGAVLNLAATRGTDVDSYTVLQDNDGVGSISFQAADGNEFNTAAAIRCQVDGTPGDNDVPGRLVFQTTADGAEHPPTERMRISSTGAFGLSGANYGTSGQFLTSAGDSSPPTWTTVGSSLWEASGDNVYVDGSSHVGIGGAPVTAQLHIQDSHPCYIRLQNTTYSASDVHIGGDNTGAYISTAGSSAQSIRFLTDSAERMRINTTGAVELSEIADAAEATAGMGQLWVKDSTPNVLMFTDDADNDSALLTASGTPADGRIGVWTGTDQLEGVGTLAYTDGSYVHIGGTSTPGLDISNSTASTGARLQLIAKSTEIIAFNDVGNDCQFRFQNSSGNAARFTIESDGDCRFYDTVGTHKGGWDASSNSFGIGVTTPGAALEIAGDIKIVDGTEGANKVLTSDADGLATWETPAATVTTVSTEGQSLSLSENGKNHVVRLDISSMTTYSVMTIPRPSACPAGRTITFTVAELGDGSQSFYLETGNTSDRFISNYDKYWGTDNSGITTPFAVSVMAYPSADQYGAENIVFTNTGTEWLMNDGVTENWSSMWYTVDSIS